MELNIVGRNLGITDRFRAYVAEKSEKVSHLADRAISLDMKLSRHNEKNGNPGPRPRRAHPRRQGTGGPCRGRRLRQVRGVRRRARAIARAHPAGEGPPQGASRGHDGRPRCARRPRADSPTSACTPPASEVLDAGAHRQHPRRRRERTAGRRRRGLHAPSSSARKVFASTPMTVDDAALLHGARRARLLPLHRRRDRAGRAWSTAARAGTTASSASTSRRRLGGASAVRRVCSARAPERSRRAGARTGARPADACAQPARPLAWL